MDKKLKIYLIREMVKKIIVIPKIMLMVRKIPSKMNQKTNKLIQANPLSIHKVHLLKETLLLLVLTVKWFNAKEAMILHQHKN